ncbi:MAG: UDP-N-acetylglucosamine 1-carboxyvinyltransferase [Clostridia bacterium]
MEKFVIEGGKKLFGITEVCSSKNAFLPIIAACILCKNEIILNKVPNILDIHSMLNIMRSLGAKVIEDKTSVIIDSSTINNTCIHKELASILRASFFCLGALLSRFGNAEISYPGGCKIGKRPIDLHIFGLKALGANIVEEDGKFICTTNGLIGSEIILEMPSVGATENIIMAAVLAKGKTIIHNPAKEPEIVDLAKFLNKMGALVRGAGTSKIEIEGVKNLFGVEYTPISDRIVAGTLVIAVATVGGKVLLKNVIPKHIRSLTYKLKKYACQITQKNDKLLIEASHKPLSVPFVETKPYPGFPTDLQSQILALQCISIGKSEIVENLFDTRFSVADELVKMGAKIRIIKNNKVLVEGINHLNGTNVEASDLRGGAALVIAGLSARGKTTIDSVNNIDRGYESLEKQLESLGAEIKRTN